MSAYQLYLTQPQEIFQEEHEKLRKNLADEVSACTKVQKAYRNKAEQLMAENDIWCLTDITYETRCLYEDYLRMRLSENAVMQYLSGFDRLKLHSLQKAYKRKSNYCTYNCRQYFLVRAFAIVEDTGFWN